mmetsp:Transcript_5551/g.12164  ORF Transcript_5551/g.12164 Transcript_5551/m.12164 type:complete len:288 (+) Transcript_5551:391-1254(+)
MPRPSTAPVVLEKLLSIIIPEKKFHDRWILDEEIATAIKDDKGSIISSFSNLNRLISKTWSFNQGRQKVNHYSITKFTACIKINGRSRLTFYYITRPTNEVTVPPPTSQSWTELYTLYIQQASPLYEPTEEEELPPNHENTTGSPNKRQRTGEKTTNLNNCSSTKVTVTVFELKLQQLGVAWKNHYTERFPDDIIFFKDVTKAQLPPAPHMIGTLPNKNYLLNYNTQTHDVYNKTTHVVLNKRDHAMLQKDQKLMTSARKNMNYKRCCLYSEHTRLRTAGHGFRNPL